MVELCLLGALLCAPPPGIPAAELTLRVEEGGGVLVARNSVSTQRFRVSVRDASGTPVPGAKVTFSLPAQGPSGRFASGMRQEFILTDDKGEAYVRGIRWEDFPGKLEIAVSADSGARSGAAAIAVEISSTLPAPKQQVVRGPSSSKKWLILAAVAGGAAAGLAVARGGGSSSAPAPGIAPLVVAPAIGQPVITIGGPR